MPLQLASMETAPAAPASYGSGSSKVLMPPSAVTQLSFPLPGQQWIASTTKIDEPGNLWECLPATDGPAIRSTEAGPLSFNSLRGYLSSCNLAVHGIRQDDAVGILFPNGPELALALLLVASQAVAAPLDPKMSRDELWAAFSQLELRHALVLAAAHEKPTGMESSKTSDLEHVAEELGCRLHRISHPGLAPAGTLQWQDTAVGEDGKAAASFKPLEETCLLLRTSGTTSKPKVVPLTAKGLYTGAVAMGQGLQLRQSDSCLNVMPFTHIGGISCSLLASLFAGSSVICASAFDPGVFIQWLAELLPTWYYAAPTIHKAIALFAANQPAPLQHHLRFIRSGAANLPHKDALEMRRLFSCKVLPTYSMSECMPIAQPPLEYELEKPGSVGLPIGASLRIADDDGHPLPMGQVGEVCLQGPVVTHGYLNDEASNAPGFVQTEDGKWFRTGDLGYLDADGFLFLTGRSKELIKRGGDQVSPYEVEEVLLAHPSVAVALVFGVPNEFWGEEVAAVMVTKDDQKSLPVDGSASSVLQRFAAEKLPDQKVPKQVVVLQSGEDLPKTRTGKYVRSGLASHLGLTAVDLAAARGLASAGAAARLPSVSAEETYRPFKPHKAIYGVRYFFACWVVFVHFGPSKPDAVAIWRDYSMSMPGYFMLAGFLLASSYTGPIGSRLQFYRNRIIAAHPLYLLSVAFVLPYLFSVCPPGGGGIKVESRFGTQCALLNLEDGHFRPAFPGSYWQQMAYNAVMVLFAQLAWPWGLLTVWLAFPNIVLWFSSAYYFCLLCFPLLHHWLTLPAVVLGTTRKHWLFPMMLSLLVALLVLDVFLFSWLGNAGPRAVSAFVDLFSPYNPMDVSPQGLLHGMLHLSGAQGVGSAGLTATDFFGYTFPLIWVFVFFLGMLLYRLLDLNHRPDSQISPWWGRFTDLCTVLLLSSLPLASLIFEIEPVHGSLKHVASDIGNWWGGDSDHKVVMVLLCPWLYGLALGKGVTARLLGSDIMVKYLSPAAYSVYLFHLPVGNYWLMIKQLTMSKTVQNADWMGWVDYAVILLATTGIALLAAHKLNAPLTTLFMKLMDGLLCCGNSICCFTAPSTEELTTFAKVQEAVKGLTGADVDPDTLIAECGLDSFGTSALLGIIKPKFPGLRLTPLEMYNLQTIQHLVDRIDTEMEANGSARQPLLRNRCEEEV